MKKKIYIAGKVSGEKLAQCTMKFGTAQKFLEDKGYEVVNPGALTEHEYAEFNNIQIQYQ